LAEVGFLQTLIASRGHAAGDEPLGVLRKGFATNSNNEGEKRGAGGRIIVF
jgi:hypothetical protein